RVGMEQWERDARIVCVVIDGEHAVSVEVVALVGLQTSGRMAGHRRAVGIFGSRELAAIKISLAPNIEALAQAPIYAALDVRNDDVAAAHSERSPRPVHAHTPCALGIECDRRALRNAVVEMPLLGVEGQAAEWIALGRRIIRIVGTADGASARITVRGRSQRLR